jgi:ribose 1,5-bisphosphokinase PhnN
MADQAAYRRYTAEAERLLKLAAETPIVVKVNREISEEEAEQIRARFKRDGLDRLSLAPPVVTIDVSTTLRAAQAWATLALAAAQDRVQPADRPTDDGPSITPVMQP